MIVHSVMSTPDIIFTKTSSLSSTSTSSSSTKIFFYDSYVEEDDDYNGNEVDKFVSANFSSQRGRS